MKRLCIVLFLTVLLTGFTFSAVAADVTLTITVNGEGTTDPAPGVHTYIKGTKVTVTAYPADGWEFVNWTGSLTSTDNPVTIRLNKSKTLTANFTYSGPPMYTLTTSVVGEGTVTPAGATQYESGTIVDVSADPAENWVFDHWEGALSGSTNPTTILMDGDKSVTGVFTEEVPPPDPHMALYNYVMAPDPNYAWNQYATESQFLYTNYFIDMTSQQWRTAEEVDRPIWQHYLILTVGWFTGDTCIILIDGGSNGGEPPTTGDPTIGQASFAYGFPVADLKQIPNQPLMFADEPGVYRSEDDMLAYSFDKYIVTKDETWNGHLPMAKASVRGMDTVQAHSSNIDDFLVVGASKRGWTAWLVAALDDARIIGYVPIVIPILNIEPQMDHHWESYGFYSSAVQPYADFDLFCRLKTEPGAEDWLLIEDPYTYLPTSSTIADKPKLLINASGDQFFMPDSLQYYWGDIPGPGTKHVRIIPNASHGMEEGDSFEQALYTALAWGTKVDDGAAQPVYDWTVDANGITMTTGSTPSGGVVMWQATNPTARDFRVETIGTVWTSSPLYDQGGNTYVGYCDPPAEGWTAYFVQVDFGNDEKYTSEIVITPDILPFAGTHCL
ncbi:MAG TPA: PhoPQ-activated protein PqaA family protein [Candidatus Bathyarchaeia archaeon]|nr:PhoPQ-activated protein PqaA family protein [Candidatus Bathyarchaeia archaeon]